MPDFDQVKWNEEKKLRRDDLALKKREQDRLDKDLEFRQTEAARSRRWGNPLIIAILGAVFTTATSAIVAWKSGDNLLQIARDQNALTKSLLQADSQAATKSLQADNQAAMAEIEALKKSNAAEVKNTLQHTLDFGLVTDPARIALIQTEIARLDKEQVAATTSQVSPASGQSSPTPTVYCYQERDNRRAKDRQFLVLCSAKKETCETIRGPNRGEEVTQTACVAVNSEASKQLRPGGLLGASYEFSSSAFGAPFPQL